MLLPLLGLLVIGGFVCYLMTPEERTRAGRAALARIPEVREGVRKAVLGDPAREEFRRALLERTPWALVTPGLIVLNTAIFIRMLFGPTAFSDPATLIGWGGNYGPLTTNGEWWRLVSSMFVHNGMLHLLVMIVGLAPFGLILERLVGPLTFSAAYLASGMLASVLSLAMHPLAVSTGASGAIFGIYGLFLASMIWSMRSDSTVVIPLAALKKVSPAAAVFILYNMASGGLDMAAELAALLVGLIYGAVLAKGVGARKPTARRVAIAMTTTMVIAAAAVIPLRGIDDVRPDIDRLITIEDRTASAYESALGRFRKRRMSAGELAQFVDQTIIPELQAAEARFRAVDKVPPEHQALMAAAEKYLRLRDESWRLRAEGLRKMHMVTLPETAGSERTTEERRLVQVEGLRQTSIVAFRHAETAERASLDALRTIRSAHE
jgi:membrane associated rhomboid family serine protease